MQFSVTFKNSIKDVHVENVLDMQILLKKFLKLPGNLPPNFKLMY